jgi:Na+/H+ antiporter NhaD/arsenite permease-like protein
MKSRHLAVLAALLITAVPAHAAGLDGKAMSWPWALPFIGIVLSIATGPLLFSHLWDRHYGKVAAAWAAVALAAVAAGFGVSAAVAALIHAVVVEYLSFIILLFALYTVGGGILVTGHLPGTPLVNATILVLGTIIASFVGTTGAAMILIRPLLRANEKRRHQVHIVVFFIILVGNVGGALSPLGDPPLYVGFLRGVEFFWPLRHLWLQTAIVAALVLAIFLALDCWFLREATGRSPEPSGRVRVRVRGIINLALIGLIVANIVLAGSWKPGIVFELSGSTIELQYLLRDAGLILIACLSLWLTPDEHRAANGFTWQPIKEVGKLFLAIFVTIGPVLAMLDAGREGAFAWLLRLVTDAEGKPREVALFWLTGGLSAFLDNAPSYLVFFQLMGGDPQTLMGPLAGSLTAISLGAVYMGALTYIGNAPNLMVYAIAQERGVKMPSFFAYLFWVALVLLPIFVLLTILPISPLL